jgi:ketosteroid isomerase-like protein
MGRMMSGWSLPLQVDKFLRAVQANDVNRLISAMESDSVLLDSGQEFRGQEISTWMRDFLGSEAAQIHPVNCQQHDRVVILTVVVNRSDVGESNSFDWIFHLDAGRIERALIDFHQSPDLPLPVDTFVRATNSGDLEVLLATFVDDALVNDQLCDYWGKEAIREWAIRHVVGERLAIHVVSKVDHYGHCILMAHVDGEFDKRGLPFPLVLAFYFSMYRDRIVQLIILRNLSGT